MTCRPQVVPSLSPQLSYATEAPSEEQLKDILDSLAQDVFPTETDSYFDLYTRELYSYPLQNEMHSKLCCKAMMTTVDYHSPPSHTTSTLQHCSFRPSDMERFTVTGEWNTLGTILQDDDGNSLQRSLHTQGPCDWTVEHVREWLVQTARDHHLGSIDYNSFAMNGEQLCNLTLNGFKLRAPLAGEILYSLLCSLKKDASSSHRHRSVHQSNVWYPKEVAGPTSPPKGEPATDTFSDCSSTSSCYFDERERTRMSSSPATCVSGLVSCSLNDPRFLASGASQLPSSTYTRVNYTPLTGIAQSLPVCESVFAYTANPSGFTSINPFPTTTYKSTKDAPPTHLRTFLKELLSNRMFAYCIEWADESQGIFRILNSEEVARFWGIRKNRPKMNYDKLSRSLRFYYKKGLLRKVPGQRLVYQFTDPSLSLNAMEKKGTTEQQESSNSVRSDE